MPFGGLWVWPMILKGTAKGVNLVHENLCLVVNTEDMRIYQIGIPELWTDRAGGYDEAEIAGEIMLPEITSRYGEHENVRHVETHVSMRSFDEKEYKGKAGFTADGFRIGHKLGLEIFEDGEQVIPETTLRDVQRNGDYAFLKFVEARRLQMKLKLSTSAFRITRVASHCQEIDFRTPPQLNDYPEKRWQKEFAVPDIWFSRNKPAVNINRADGAVWTGTGTTLAGPDGKTKSAFTSFGFNGATSFATGDFVISAWVLGDGIIYNAQIQGGGNVRVQVTGGILRFTDFIDVANITLFSTISWVLVTAIRRGNNIELYENGRLKLSQPLTAVRIYGGATVIGSGTMFDLRRNIRAISGDSLYFYYESVLKGGGGFLP
jgi:hypothetical protein